MWMEWIPVWRLSACSGRLSTRAFERERVFVCHIYVNGQFTHNKIISWRGLANKVCSMSPSNSAEHRRMLHRSHRVQLKKLNRETKAKSLRCARSVGNLTLTLSYVSHSFRPFCITVAWVDQQVFPFNFGLGLILLLFVSRATPLPLPSPSSVDEIFTGKRLEWAPSHCVTAYRLIEKCSTAIHVLT